MLLIGLSNESRGTT